MPAVLVGGVKRRVQADAKAKAAAARMERLVRAAWADILRALPAVPSPGDRSEQHVVSVLRQLNQLLPELMRDELEGIAAWSHTAAAADIARRVRRGAKREGIGDLFRRFLHFILPAPAVPVLRRIVGKPHPKLTRMADPQKAAGVVLRGVAAGKTRAEIVRDLKPVVQQAVAVAKRVARTEGLRVATETQLHVSEQLPDLIVGYRVVAVLDERTRPQHRARDGTVYWRVPKRGQLGFDAMPRPPVEADGTIAWNCRCFMEPVWADD